MTTIANIVREAFESTAVRFAVFALALGAVPFYLLSLAIASLGG